MTPVRADPGELPGPFEQADEGPLFENGGRPLYEVRPCRCPCHEAKGTMGRGPDGVCVFCLGPAHQDHWGWTP